MANIRTISPGDDPVSALALEGLMETAPILQDVDFYSKMGPADSVKTAREGAVKVKITRSLNEDNVAVAPTPVYSAVAKSIVSFDATADVILEDRNEDPESELAVQTRLEAREAGWVLQNMCFVGDHAVDPEDFDGMVNLVNVNWVINNGVLVPVGNSDAMVEAQQIAIETLLQLFARVRGSATHAYMNEFLKIRWLTVGKNLGYYRQSKDELGNAIDMIGNTIIRGAGYQKNGTPNLPFTELVGGVPNTSSIYCVRWGERTDFTALTSVGCKGRYAGQIGNQLLNNVNMDMVLVLQDATALVQSTGWRLTA